MQALRRAALLAVASNKPCQCVHKSRCACGPTARARFTQDLSALLKSRYPPSSTSDNRWRRACGNCDQQCTGAIRGENPFQGNMHMRTYMAAWPTHYLYNACQGTTAVGAASWHHGRGSPSLPPAADCGPRAPSVSNGHRNAHLQAKHDVSSANRYTSTRRNVVTTQWQRVTEGSVGHVMGVWPRPCVHWPFSCVQVRHARPAIKLACVEHA